MFAVPSMNRSWNSFELDPRSLDPSSSGKISPPASKLPPMVVIPEIDAPPCLCRVIPAPTPMFIALASVVPSYVKLVLSHFYVFGLSYDFRCQSAGLRSTCPGPGDGGPAEGPFPNGTKRQQ